MILAIADVLSAADVAEVCSGLATATFVDGKSTAGWAARLVKANLQASQGPDLERVRALVETRLAEHAVFALATRPKTILGPLFSRYLPGHAYGAHVDDALMGGVRTDVAFTLFLSDAGSCDGGELIIDTGPRLAALQATPSPIRVTERAAAHFRAQLARQAGAIAVRLSVRPSGCSGYGYSVEPALAIRDGDRVFETQGVRVFVDPASLPYVQGSTLDVVPEGLARRLRFDNPNARQTCGCGESFGPLPA